MSADALSSPAQAFVSVVIPVRNGQDFIGDCLGSIIRTNYPPDRREILVVDNGSTDRTAEIAQGFAIRYLLEPRPGPSHARNRAIREGRGQIFAFMDVDCVATTEWLRELVEPFKDRSVWGVAGEIVSYPPRTRAQKYMAVRKGQWQKPALESLSWPFAVTANVAYRRETFERIGLFDPFLLRAQDKDLGRRFFEAGLKIEYSPNALVFHRHRETAWGFFKQHEGWGYGAALLHAKYGLPWGWRGELGKYRELAGSAWTLLRSSARFGLGSGNGAEVTYALFEVLRRIAHRVGALRGMALTAPGRLGWTDPPWVHPVPRLSNGEGSR